MTMSEVARVDRAAAIVALVEGGGSGVLRLTGFAVANLGASGVICTEAEADLEAQLVDLVAAVGKPMRIGLASFPVQQVRPVAADATRQLSSGSRAALAWHTEEAYRPDPPDLVVLCCVRNPGRTATTWWSTGRLDLDAPHWNSLREPVFAIEPDDTQDGLRRRVPVWDGFRLRADSHFMQRQDEPTAAEVWTRLVARIDADLQRVRLEPGDVLVLDNRRVVHGRDVFVARFDGRDRWLKRLLVRVD